VRGWKAVLKAVLELGCCCGSGAGHAAALVLPTTTRTAAMYAFISVGYAAD
jgi:hypothetical protein